jgi:hypothetical protein
MVDFCSIPIRQAGGSPRFTTDFHNINIKISNPSRASMIANCVESPGWTTIKVVSEDVESDCANAILFGSATIPWQSSSKRLITLHLLGLVPKPLAVSRLVLQSLAGLRLVRLLAVVSLSTQHSPLRRLRYTQALSSPRYRVLQRFQ